MGNVCPQPKLDPAFVEEQKQKLQEKLDALYSLKLILLGPGESGKSTVLKQLKSIYDVKPTAVEIETCMKGLHSNVLECMKALCDAADRFHNNVNGTNLMKTKKWIQEESYQFDDEVLITPQQAKDIQELFECGAMRKTFARRDEFWILDSIDYLMENIHRFAEEDFKPNEKDFVMCRVRTTGFLETKLRVPFPGRQEGEPDKLTYYVLDVGGQRNERLKWRKIFKDVKAIVFLVNLAGYNQVLFEAVDRNRMAEALELFEQIMSYEDEAKKRNKDSKNKKKVIVDLFQHTPVYLLLNKKDLFEVMIRKVGLNKTFPDYKGNTKSDQALAFIQKKFQEKCPPGRTVEMFDITGVSRFDVKTTFRQIEKDLLAKNRDRIKEERRRILDEQKKLDNEGENGGGCVIA